MLPFPSENAAFDTSSSISDGVVWSWQYYGEIMKIQRMNHRYLIQNIFQ
jgi:hypothetical protein